MKFYPRDIQRWRGVFNFPPKMLPLPDFYEFDSYTIENFLDFLKDHGVRFDDENAPLEFILRRDGSVSVIQWTGLGTIEGMNGLEFSKLNYYAKHYHG